ncbi:hypothetical protein CDIK_1321 [Cucumispora dikerogammari]|nr:hypothetical protein CDIK_1321 [Cucumispora dikerogammari]
MFCSYTRVSIDFLRRLLYSNKGFEFDFNDNHLIKGFYYTIAYFIRYYNPNNPLENKVNFIRGFLKDIDYRSTRRAKLFHQLIIEHYTDYLLIDISYKSKNKWNDFKDLSFQKYTDLQNTLNFCCFADKNCNLITKHCIVHQDYIWKIREQYCEHILYDFTMEYSIFYGRVLWALDAKFSCYLSKKKTINIKRSPLLLSKTDNTKCI